MAHIQVQRWLIAPDSPQLSPDPHEQIIAMAHDARQKMCSNVLNAHLIMDLLPEECPNRAIIAQLLTRISDASKLADAKLDDIQVQALDSHPGTKSSADCVTPLR